MGDADAAAGAGRLMAALTAMPFALAGAFLSTGLPASGAPAAIMVGAVLLALPMILCAAVYLSAAPVAVGSATLLVYGGGLAAAAMASGASTPVLWLLAAAMPIEAWLVRRTTYGVMAGVAVAAAVLVLLSSREVLTGNPLVVVPVALAYIAFIIVRISATPSPAAEMSGAGGLDAVEHAIDGVVARLSNDGVIRDISARSASRLGVAPGMLLETLLLDRVHVSDRIHYLAALADLRAGAEGAVIDLRLRRSADGPDGHCFEFRTFRVEIGACRDHAGRLDSLLVVARDICDDVTARKALEQALEEAEGVQLSKSRFLASVSHELRTPLNSIIGFSDILLHEMFGSFTDERQREYVQLIQQSGTHLLAVVNAILDVSKLEAGNYSIVAEPFAFKDAVSMARAMMAHQADQKGVVLIDRVDAVLGEVVADRRAIQQILINLISNAVKFTDKGGVVTVDAVRDGSNLVFSVGDTGIGMSAEDLKKLGRPFFQIHNDYTRAYEGTGLGISLVKGLVELHGGVLDIASRPGEGTVVTVTIPQAGSRPATAAKPVEEARIVELKRKAEDQGAKHAAIRKTG